MKLKRVFLPLLILTMTVLTTLFMFLTDHWSGSASGNAFIVTITMDSEKNITANSRAQNGTGQKNYGPDEIIWRFKPGVNQTVRDALLQRYNVTIVDEIPEIGVLGLKVNPSELDRVIEELSHNPNVEHVTRNYYTYAWASW